MSNVTFPTEVIDLPSKGKFYPVGHPLASGQIELKYMTAKEEDILTSQNLIQKGIVLDKLIDSLIVTKGVTHEDLLLGDLNAVMVASRILGYGKDYPVNVTCPKCGTSAEHVVDLSQLESKDITNMLVADTRALREFYKTVTPDVKFEAPYTCEKCDNATTLPISIGLNFFWPDARI